MNTHSDSAACGGCHSGGVDSAACGGCHSGGAGCAACGGCSQHPQSGELLLCREEILLLEDLAQFAFLPVIRQREGETQRYLPVEPALFGGALPLGAEIFSKVIESLLWKRLISVDEALPMENVAYGAAAARADCSCGSIALTLQGQEALPLLSLDGWESESAERRGGL